jgi:hypothetical protein
MSITSAKTGATGISLALENNFMEPIASTLVGAGGVSTVIFNDIPQTYKHLQIRTMCLTSASATDVKLQFNSDVGTNYTQHLLWGNGSAPFSSAYISTTYIAAGVTSITTANPAAGVIDILDYTNTNKNKTVRTLSGSDTNGVGGFIFFESGMWINTAAVTSVILAPYSGTFNQYSRISLYGIKG